MFVITIRIDDYSVRRRVPHIKKRKSVSWIFTLLLGVFYDSKIVAGELHFNGTNGVVGTRMLRASGIESLECLITDPPLIAFRNDLSRAACWFNLRSRVIRHRRQHQSSIYLTNPTKNFFVTSFGESEARSTALPIDSSIKERSNPRASAFSLSCACMSDYRAKLISCIPVRSRSDRGIWSDGAKCRPINRSITDTATLEKVFDIQHVRRHAALRHYYATVDVHVHALGNGYLYVHVCIWETKAQASRCIKPN